VFVLGDASDAPSQGVRSTAGNTGADERVEDLPFGHAQPGPDRDAQVGEDDVGRAAGRGPRDFASESPLGPLGYRYSGIAGCLAELLDLGQLGGVWRCVVWHGVVWWPVPRPVSGWLQRADDHDLVSVHERA